MTGRVALGVFARAPDGNGVKTRLASTLGAAAAARLYARLLERTLDLARAAEVESRAIYVDAPSSVAWFTRFPDFAVRVQEGVELAARMATALGEMLATHDAALVIGSDLADATASDLTRAARWLRTAAEVVLGPTADGGYWLIGTRGVRPALFAGIAWSTPRVYAQTVTRIAEQRLHWRALPLRHDVDTAADLAHLAASPADGIP